MILIRLKSTMIYLTVAALVLPMTFCLVPIKLPANGQLLNLPALNPNSLNVAKLNSLLPNAGTEVALPISDLTAGRNIKILVPKAAEILAGSRDFDARATDILKQSVPKALNDFGVNANLADRGVPLVKAAVQGILSGDPSLLKRDLVSRGIFGDLWDWIEDAGCAVFAAAAAPAYLLAAGDFAVANGGGQRMNNDLLYHMWPVHGDLAATAPVTVYFSATRPPFFGSAEGTTMNRDIYTPLGAPPSFDWKAYQGQLAADFTALVQLLLHEMEHVKQYRDLNYNLPAFAHKYLFNFCKAGGYSKNPLEQDAVVQGRKMNTELVAYSGGVEFFLIWRTFNLLGSLGYPTEIHSHLPDGVGTGLYEKNFEHGVLQTKDPVSTGGPRCFRTFTNEEIAKKIVCTGWTPGTCFTKREQAQTHDRRGIDSIDHDGVDSLTMEKRGLERRSPLPPIKGTDQDGVPRGKNLPCTPDERAERKKACDAKTAEWRALNARPWRCGMDVP